MGAKVNKEVLARQILAYLNGEISESDLVRWAEDEFIALSEAQSELPDESLLLDILGYLGAGDTTDFPLTWGVLSDFLESLGTRVKVVAQPS